MSNVSVEIKTHNADGSSTKLVIPNAQFAVIDAEADEYEIYPYYHADRFLPRPMKYQLTVTDFESFSVIHRNKNMNKESNA
jgi:hypothetical protein